MEGKLTSFRADYGATGIYGVTTNDLEKWIAERAGGLSALTRLHYRRCLHRLFSFAFKRGYCAANPAAVLEKPALDEKEPEIHRPDEVRAILAQAQETAPRMIPYLAIGYFAGLRTENELARLDWREIDLVENIIKVSPATAKKRRSRYVTISANLAAWLLPHRETDGRIFYSRRAFRNIIAKLNEARAQARKPEIQWPRNAMRHSFASYHLAAHNDAALTSAQLGHADGNDVLFQHYRKLVKAKEAAEFWNIKPAATGNVIQLRQAVA
jgi:integrase